jgi:hypothetical protein
MKSAREVACAFCGKPATCAGVYADGREDEDPRPACDDCCGHGSEDGLCFQLDDYEVSKLPPDWRPVFAALVGTEERLN